MKVLILCGGNGLRIKGHFHDVPKPLIPIKGKPLLSYIIDRYSMFGVRDFILLVGNNEELFHEFADNFHNKDIIIRVEQTGLNTATGGRLKKAKYLLTDDEPFFLTYGDGIADIDINLQISFHLEHGKIATLSAIKPQLPFGILEILSDSSVTSFTEKPLLDRFINGGFFILNTTIFQLIEEDSDFETEILPQLSQDNQLKAYIHNGFWKNMDTYKDYLFLDSLALEKIVYL